MTGKIIITEGVAPSAPVGTGKHTIYIDTADDKLKIKNTSDDVSVVASEASVTSSVSGILASTAEANAGVSTAKAVTPAGLASFFTNGSIFTIIPSDNRRTNISGGVGMVVNGGVLYKIFSFISPVTGTIRTFFTINSSGGSNQGVGVGRIYKNGVEFGTLRTYSSYSGSSTYTEDLAFTKGDTIELRGRLNSGAGTASSLSGFYLGYSSMDNAISPTQHV